jgi:phenylalanine-4-hydroxylase
MRRKPLAPRTVAGGDPSTTEFFHVLAQQDIHSPYKGLLSYQDSRADRVWSLFYGNHLKTLGQYADFISPEYLKTIDTVGFRVERMPTMKQLRSRLHDVGWDVAPVSGYLKGDALFAHLHARRFPLSLPIRSEQFIEHSPMPDFIHDVLGHYPFLFVDGYRRFAGRLAERFLDAAPCPLEDRLFAAQERLSMLVNVDGEASLVADAQRDVNALHAAIDANPSRRSLLLRLYLWAVEFGFMDSGRALPKVVGAGILSSKEELRWAIEQKKVPLDRHNVNTPYDFTNLQSQYFSFRDWESLEALLFQI